MKSLKIIQSSIVIFLALFIFFMTQPVEFGRDTSFFHGFPIKKPIVKVSLGLNLTDIQIKASGGMKIYEVQPRYRLIADDVLEVFIKGYREKLSEKFLIQVYRSEDEDKAQRYAQRLRTQIEAKVYVRPIKGKRELFQVLVGDFMTRGDALKFIRVLLDLGYKEAWIVTENISDHSSRPFWIAIGDQLKSLNDETTLYFIPSHPRSFLSFRDRAYRGIFVLQSSKKGLLLINILNLEDYLKSVVPSELSPYNFPALEAHKAQAVASRTYALRNIAQANEMEYDLEDTPTDQYYKGMNAEHPLSTRAVEETRGEVITYRGQLIDALYTSTCGGQTENVENIFLGPALPYLRSTECFYEKQKEWLISTSFSLPPVFIRGTNCQLALAELMALGVIPKDNRKMEWYREMLSEAEALNWIRLSLNSLGRASPSPSTDLSSSSELSHPITWSNLIKILGQAFSLKKRVAQLYPSPEQSFLNRDFEFWPVDIKPFLVYFAQEGILEFNQDELIKPEEQVLRGEFALILNRFLKQEGLARKEGIFLRRQGDSLLVRDLNNNQEISLPLDPEVILVEDRPTLKKLVSHFHLLGGEKLVWWEKESKPTLIEVALPFPSNVLDRTSPYRLWKVHFPQEKLSRRINRFYPVGELIDVIPLRRGESNRVVELMIKGASGEVRVQGLQIRRVLGLKDTLFVIDREYGPDGKVKSFIFTGRGWGHGVGLCQVGSYGMALSGANYREILKKYYHGVKITKFY